MTWFQTSCVSLIFHFRGQHLWSRSFPTCAKLDHFYLIKDITSGIELETLRLSSQLFVSPLYCLLFFSALSLRFLYSAPCSENRCALFAYLLDNRHWMFFFPPRFWLLGFLASWLLGFLASWLFGFLASYFLASWLLGFLASWLLGFLASWLFGFLASRLLGFLAFSWLLGFLASWLFWLLGFLAFRLLGFSASGLCGFWRLFCFSHPLHSQFLFGRWRFGFCGFSLFYAAFGGFGFSYPAGFLAIGFISITTTLFESSLLRTS